jgi:hypothetical protein
MKKILHTYFFGYAAYKYRRLIRTLILLIGVGRFVFLKLQGENYDIITVDLFFFMISVLLITALISYLVEPFIIEKKL